MKIRWFFCRGPLIKPFKSLLEAMESQQAHRSEFCSLASPLPGQRTPSSPYRQAQVHLRRQSYQPEATLHFRLRPHQTPPCAWRSLHRQSDNSSVISDSRRHKPNGITFGGSAPSRSRLRKRVYRLDPTRGRSSHYLKSLHSEDFLQASTILRCCRAVAPLIATVYSRHSGASPFRTIHARKQR